MVHKAIRHIEITRPYQKTPLYTVLIPAAGMGHRMKCYGPKSLIKITPKLTIFQHQLNIIKKTLRNKPNIILVTGFHANKVMNNIPDDIVKLENENYENTNVTRSIGIGLRAITTNHVIIIYGDLIFNKYALQFPIDDKSRLIIDSSNTMTKDEVGCVIHNKIIEHVGYDLDNKWAQILYLTGKELRLAQTLCWNPNFYRYFGFEMINEIIKRGGEFKIFKPCKIQANDVDCIKDLDIVRKII